jgi:hypothetical protein
MCLREIVGDTNFDLINNKVEALLISTKDDIVCVGSPSNNLFTTIQSFMGFNKQIYSPFSI